MCLKLRGARGKLWAEEGRVNVRHLLVAVLAVAVVAPCVRGAGTPAARQQSRADHVLYTAPAGWKHADNDRYTALRPADVPAGKAVELRIHPARPLAGTLDAAAAAQVEQFRQAYPGAQAYRMNPVRHQTGFDMIITGVARPVPGGAVYHSLCFVKAGDQVQLVEMESSDFELYQKHSRTWDALLHGLRLTDAVVLAKGDPPLTQATVDEITDFLEWLIEVPFTEEQKAMVAGNVTDSWKRNDREEIEGTLQALKLRAQLSQMTPQQKALARQAAQPELIKAARQETDPVAKMIVRVYEAGHQPIADGDPPLTRQAADAMLEVLFFMAAQVRGGDAAATALPPPTREMKDQWAKNLAANYDKADAAAKKEIAKMPLTWAAIRMLWPDLPEPDKSQARAQWARSDEVRQVAEVMDRMGLAGPAQNGAGGNGFVADGKSVVYVDGRSRSVVFNLDTAEAARARAAEMNMGRDGPSPQAGDAAGAAELMAERTRDYQFTRSMLNMGYNNTIMQMAAMSGNQWRYK
jgi:hypothetical protein